MKILLVIPCFKCEKQINRVIDSLKIEILKKIDKVLILDNQSPDQTAQIAITKIKSLGLDNKIIVGINNQNYGLGGSHKVGFSYAMANNYDYMAILHGDDQAKTSDLLSLIHMAENRPQLAAILGARFMLTSSLEGYSLLRISGNLFFNTLYSLVTLRIIKDLGSGINLFKVSEHEWDSIKSLGNHFSFNYDLILYYKLRNKKMTFVPITWRETDQVSNVRNVQIGLKALKILSNYLFSKKLTYEEPRVSYSFTEL